METYLGGGIMTLPAGGRVARAQMNFQYIGDDGVFPFLNVLKQGNGWSDDSTGLAVDPVQLNAQGYPVTESTSIGVNIPDPASERPGNYVVAWTGNMPNVGTVFLSGTFVSGATNGTGNIASGQANPGRAIYTPPAGGSLTFKLLPGGGTSTITDVYICHVDDELDLLAGKLFGKKFLAKLREGNFGVIRFMQWQTTGGAENNASNITTWSTRKPQNYFSWLAPCHVDSTGTSLVKGTTTNVGNDFSLSYGTGGFTDKELIVFKLNASATGAALGNGTSVSFNCTGTGGSPQPVFVNWNSHGLSAGEPVSFYSAARSIFNLPSVINPALAYYVTAPTTNQFQISTTSGGAALNDTSTYTNGFVPNEALRCCTFKKNTAAAVPMKSFFGVLFSGPLAGYFSGVYDAALNILKIVDGQGFNSSCPYEVMVSLANELHIHPHFVVPGTTVDPLTDFITGLATLCKTSLNPGLVPRFETPNETWNSFMYQTLYGDGKSQLYWGAQDIDNWVGMVASTLGQAVNSVYGGTIGNGYQVLVGVQTSRFETLPTDGNDPRMTAATWVAQGPNQPIWGGGGTNYTRAAASNYATHSCCTTYFKPKIYGTGPVTFTAKIDNGLGTGAGTTMNVSAIAPDSITVGGTVVGSGVAASTTITSLGTGVGGTGTYNVSVSQSLSSISGLTASKYNGTFTARIDNGTPGVAGTIMTVTAVVAGTPTIFVGSDVIGPGVAANTVITADNGANGLTGLYSVSVSQNLASTSGLTGSTYGGNLNEHDMRVSYMSAGTAAAKYTLATQYASLSGANAPGWVVQDNITLNQTTYANFLAWTQKFTNNAGNKIKMTAYEGGYSPDYDKTAADTIRAASKYTAVLQGIVLQNLQNFVGAGGEWPSLFQFSAAIDTAQANGIDNNVWSVLTDVYSQSPASLPGAPFPAPGTAPPQWQAYVTFNT